MIDREGIDRRFVLGRLATGELSFREDDEDRNFETFGLPHCPECGRYPRMEKRRFGSQNRYRICCDTETCHKPADSPFMANGGQAQKLWRMNCLLRNSGQT